MIVKSHPVNEDIASAGRGVENPNVAPITANSQNTDPPRVDPIKKDGSGLETESRGLDTYSEDLEAFLACGSLYRWNRLNDKYRPGSPIAVVGSEFLKSNSGVQLTP